MPIVQCPMETKQGAAYTPCLVGPVPLDSTWNPDGHMRANIQDNENAPAFTCPKCWTYHRCFHVDETNGDIQLEIQCKGNKEAMMIHRCIPNRCLPCARELKRWQRGKAYQKRLLLKFERERHHHIRMITFGWLGVRDVKITAIGSKKKVDNKLVCNCPILRARAEMVSALRALRKKPFWTEHVDGGYWFFECPQEPIDDEQTHINPHMHLVVLCPKMFPYRQMNNYLEELRWKNSGGATAKLGNSFINHSRNKDGTIKKSKPKDAVNYCVNYVKKDNQFDGKNRGPFGIVLHRRRCSTPACRKAAPPPNKLCRHCSAE